MSAQLEEQPALDTTSVREIGSRPGTLVIPEGSPPPIIRLFEFDADTCEELEIDDVETLQSYARTPRTTWIDIQGLGDVALLQRIGEIFGIHRLALADAVNAPQRPKTEVYDEHVVVIARAPDANFDSRAPVPQVCILLSESYIITFQEHRLGFFEAVRARLRDGVGRPIRRSGPCYLAYALLDALVDHYAPVIDEFSERLDELEDRLMLNPDPEHLMGLHEVRRTITALRRVARPQREALLRLSNEPSALIREETHLYLRDCYDHASQALEALEALRDTTSDLMDTALATLGHRSNEVMKVLTLMASIFIPLTFIAGIYGMNFENMPELRHPSGYPTALSVMFLVAIGMLGYFRHRGWLGKVKQHRHLED